MENKEINLYEVFKKMSYRELKEKFAESKTREEQDFYITLANLKLQKEQEKIINK